MRAVVQRVTSAAVNWVDDSRRHERSIGRGVLVLVGIGPHDHTTDALRLAQKIAHLRIFPDAEGRTNLSLADVRGAALVVSQFTLYADLGRGRRPSFTNAGDPGHAQSLYVTFAAEVAATGIDVVTGSFGANMKVSLVNDGPMTLVVSTDDWQTRA